jgi:hypothetical protein
MGEGAGPEKEESLLELAVSRWQVPELVASESKV